MTVFTVLHEKLSESWLLGGGGGGGGGGVELVFLVV